MSEQESIPTSGAAEPSPPEPEPSLPTGADAPVSMGAETDAEPAGVAPAVPEPAVTPLPDTAPSRERVEDAAAPAGGESAPLSPDAPASSPVPAEAPPPVAPAFETPSASGDEPGYPNPPTDAKPRAEAPPAPEAATADVPASGDSPLSVVSGRPDFAASLETFHGPLDLLLYLIKEEEVEIANIPIARVLEQYLKFIDAAQDLDMHMAGEFLVMATTLMEIKSRELLPVQEALEGEELIEDPRSELVRQLLRYRQLKERARFLESRMDRWQQQRSRGMLDEIPEPAPDEAEPLPMPEIDLYELLTLFERLRKSVLAQVPRAVGYEGETLEEKVVRIEKTLQANPFTRFSALIHDVRSRADIALTFIALLELVRRRMIRLVQEGAFGNLDVKVQTQEEAEALAQNEAVAAENVVDIAFREKAEREAKLAAEAAALGVPVDKLPWKARRAALARPKFEGIVRPEDVEELDAEDVEISRRIDAILAAADAISQRFEDSHAGQSIPQEGGPVPQDGAVPGGEPGKGAVPGAPVKAADGKAAVETDEEDRPLTEEDLAPRPEQPPEPEDEPGAG